MVILLRITESVSLFLELDSRLLPGLVYLAIYPRNGSLKSVKPMLPDGMGLKWHHKFCF